MDSTTPTNPADVPIRPCSAPEPERAPLTGRAAYTRERAKRKRIPGSNRTVPTMNRPAEIPPGIRLVTDGAGREWTDVYGAAVLGGICRRTVYAWKHRGWLQVRYLASGKMEVLVESLWWSEADRQKVVKAAARAAERDERNLAEVPPATDTPHPEIDDAVADFDTD